MLDAMALLVEDDSFSWRFSSEGVYSVRFVYDSLSGCFGGGMSELAHLLARVWKSWDPLKVQVFSW